MFRSRLTRCSQGQGFWAWQYLEQWIGLHVDSISRTLELAPRGLLSSVDWKGFAVGENRFDVSWEESQAGMEIRVRNRNDEPWTLRTGIRPPGSGAEARLSWKTRIMAPGAETEFFVPASGSRAKSPVLRPFSDIVAGRVGDKDGIVFSPFGHPFLYGVPDNDTIAVRLYLLNGTKSDWNDVSVRLFLPEGWLGRSRVRGEFVKPVDLVPGELKVDLGNLASRCETVAPFWVKTPFTFDRTVSLGAANRILDSEGPARGKLVLSSPGIEAVQETAIEAAMSAVTPKGAKIGRRISVRLEISPPEKAAGFAGV